MSGKQLNESNTRFREITFGQGRGFLILDPQLITHITNAVVNRARVNLFNGNKFYKTFEISDLMTLKQIVHRATFNLKGRQNTGFLYLFRYLARPYCVYIRQKLQQLPQQQQQQSQPQQPQQQEQTRQEPEYEYVIVKHRFDESLYQGTLFHGNFLQVNEYQNIFLISDLLIWKDRAHLDSLSDKLTILNSIFADSYTADPALDTHQVLMKEYCELNCIKDFVTNYRNTLPYRNFINGIILRPEVRNQRLIVLTLDRPDSIPNLDKLFQDRTEDVDPWNSPTTSTTSPTSATTVSTSTSVSSPSYGYSETHKIADVTTSKSELKQRPKNPVIDHTKHPNVIFKMKKTGKPDVYELYLSDSEKKYGIAAISSLNHSEQVRKWFSQEVDSVVVRAEYVQNFNKWRPFELIQNPTVSPNSLQKLV
jgi:hypothetical protein